MDKRAALRALLAGCGAGLVLTATMLTLRLWLAAPAFPERIADGILLLIPQALFSMGLSTFGFAAKPLLFVAIVAAQVAAAGIGGLLYGAAAIGLAGRLDLTNPAVGGAIGVLLGLALDFVLLPVLGAGFPVSAMGGSALPAALALAALPGLAYGLALAALLWLASPPRPRREPLTGAFVVDRERLARRTVIALLLPALGALVTASALRRLIGGPTPAPATGSVPDLPPPATAAPQPTAPPLAAARQGVTATAAPPVPTTRAASPSPAAGTIAGALPTGAPPPVPPPSPAITPLSGTTPSPTAAPMPTMTPTPSGPTMPLGVAPLVTPTQDLYLVSKNLIDPALSGEAWQLTIGGLVERPQTLRRAELLLLPPVRLAATLECISNEPGGALIGTAVWDGVPLWTLLAGAAIRPEATHVVFTCADDYVERLPLAQALDPATLLVHTMNDAPLPGKHGFPARLLAAGRYGMKNPKWVVRIELVNGAVPSYWSQRGWNPDAPVQVFTRIDAPTGAVSAGPVGVGGVAYAGDRGISRVELSADGGATWLPTRLESTLSPVTWVRWVTRWTPAGPGSYTLSARAFEADGTPQVAETRTLNASGSTGYGRRVVVVGSR